MKNLKIIVVFIIIIAGVGIYKYLNSGWDGQNDIRMAIVTPKEIGMVIISPERKMVSTLKIDQQVKIWIPGGMGWYQSNRFKRIVEQENLGSRVADVFFYNFGFLANDIIYLDTLDDWRNDRVLWGQLGGLGGIIKYKMLSDKLIYKEDVVSSELVSSEGNLDEIMGRDFADNRLLNDEFRMSIINTTSESGLANFIGNRLGWAGFSVVAIENSSDLVENCMLVFGPEAEISYTGQKIKNIFDCQIKKDSGLGSREIELYLGQKMASVINYPSYVGTF
jgi:hypothetical protein